MIECGETAQLFPDLFSGALDEKHRRELLEHMNTCVACSDLADLWGRLGDLPAEAPDPATRTRFEAMLNGYLIGAKGKATRLEPAAKPRRWFGFGWQIGWAAAALVLGLLLGRSFVAHPADDTQLVQLQNEVHATRQLVALSLLQQQSASERLRGINWTTRLEEPDPQVIAALEHALKYDPSVDVRLAAVDALRRYRGNPLVRSALADALTIRQSPLVQISLIDLLVETRDPDATRLLQRLRSDPAVNPAVKQRAQWALQQF
jgi:anti-sigma factor RsiW